MTLPYACTLAPGQRRDRVAFIEALVRDALLELDDIPRGVRARFRRSPDVEDRVRLLAAAEARCCGFLSFAVGREEGAVSLSITGPPEVRPAIEAFFAAARSSAAGASPAAAAGGVRAGAAQPAAAPR